MKILKGDIDIKNPYNINVAGMSPYEITIRKTRYDIYKEGQQSILSQMVEVDHDALLLRFQGKWAKDISYTDSFALYCHSHSFEQFIQQEKEGKDNGKS
jgi:hypothetical protein